MLVARLGRGLIEFGRIRQHCRKVESRESGAARTCFGLGNAQQGAEDAADIVEVGDALLHRAAQLLLGAGLAQALLQLGAGAGDGRAQVMGDGIGDAAHPLHQRLDPVEHGIHALAQPVELITPAGDRHAA